MRKRPLCLAAVLLLMILWILPKDVWLIQPDIPSGKILTITGTVTKREQKEDKQVYYLNNCLCNQTDSKISVLAYTPKGDSYPIGCELSLYGTIYQLNKADNPGQFDGESYYQSQGILYTFQTETVVYARGGSFVREGLIKLREYFSSCIMQIYNERDAGIIKAVLLGDKSTLREEDQLLYQKNGISHLLAISGLHISMIGVSLYKLLRKCNLTFLEAGLPSGILLLLYGIMTGFGVSTIRAICMFIVMLFADIFGRAYDMASAMALAAIIILIRNPLQARQAGFLLSFGAVFGICCVYPILQAIFQTEKKAFQSILFSLSISLVTYPISVHFFYEYSLYSVVLNFIVIPCMPFVMGFGGAGMLVGCMAPKVGVVVGIPAHLVLEFYEILGKWIVKWPFAVIRLGSEEFWQLIVYYVILIAGLLLLWYGRQKIYSFLLPVAFVIVTLRFRSGLEFTMLDVGQGDGLFLRFPSGTTCFIDGGSASVKNVGEYRILSYLKYEGVSKLDYVIFTHLDEDHMSGMRELLEMGGSLDEVSIGTILFPAISNPDEKYFEMWELAKEKGIAVDTIGAGDRIAEEGLMMECLYPIKGSYSEDKNASSTVLQVTYDKFSMLLTGDLGWDGERELLQSGVLKDVDVWKVSHHGSKYSGCEEFLSCIQPNVSLISVGRNFYGHPTDEILERLDNIGSQVWTTLDSGAIMLESDGEGYTIQWQR
ncbi:MAG: DNA internalization-related competence protein ComEC/Rec2 [Lachnospiraceae bacterium]|nr:DNA internalization-related competence protein ComEC/Rec2 [Lachnospiraceae bacterium]